MTANCLLKSERKRIDVRGGRVTVSGTTFSTLFMHLFYSNLFVCLFVCRGSIPDNLRKFVRGEPEEFVQKQDMVALGSR